VFAEWSEAVGHSVSGVYTHKHTHALCSTKDDWATRKNVHSFDLTGFTSDWPIEGEANEMRKEKSRGEQGSKSHCWGRVLETQGAS